MLAAGVAHDFGQLVALIAHQVERAREAASVDGRPRKHLDLAEQAIEQARGITRALQAYAQGEHAESHTISLNDVCRESARLLSQLVPAKVVQCLWEIPQGPVHVQAKFGAGAAGLDEPRGECARRHARWRHSSPFASPAVMLYPGRRTHGAPPSLVPTRAWTLPTRAPAYRPRCATESSTRSSRRSTRRSAPGSAWPSSGASSSSTAAGVDVESGETSGTTFSRLLPDRAVRCTRRRCVEP